MVSGDFCDHDWPGSGCPECMAARDAARQPHTTITVCEWGTAKLDGNIPYRLTELIAELQAALVAVPESHRATAHVDCEPDYEFGEHYAAMRVTYQRPMDADELAAWAVERRQHWGGQLAEADRRVAYCRGELGIPPT